MHLCFQDNKVSPAGIVNVQLVCFCIQLLNGILQVLSSLILCLAGFRSIRYKSRAVLPQQPNSVLFSTRSERQQVRIEEGQIPAVCTGQKSFQVDGFVTIPVNSSLYSAASGTSVSLEDVRSGGAVGNANAEASDPPPKYEDMTFHI